MTLVTFFKKIIGKDTVATPLKEERISFDKIGFWVGNKEKTIKKEEEEVFALIKERVVLFIEDFEEKISVLENVDIESKNVENRIKLIVKQNVNNYVHQARKFTKNMRSLPEEELENVIKHVNNALSEFHKATHLSYQKATILIGKEIAQTKKNIHSLSQDLAKIVKENQHVIDDSLILSFVRTQLREVEKENEHLNEINKELTLINKKIKRNKELVEKTLNTVDAIKKSKTYINNLKKQKAVIMCEEEIKKSLHTLRKKINFKELGNCFHVSKKKMCEVTRHKERFAEAFQEDSGNTIRQLLDEAKLNTQEITTITKQINKKKKEREEISSTIKKDDSKGFLITVNGAEQEGRELAQEKTTILKRLEKVKKNKILIKDSIKQALDKQAVLVSD